MFAIKSSNGQKGITDQSYSLLNVSFIEVYFWTSFMSFIVITKSGLTEVKSVVIQKRRNLS